MSDKSEDDRPNTRHEVGVREKVRERTEVWLAAIDAVVPPFETEKKE